jgi:S-adenosylmethionine synthetase, C-terminal domain
MKTYEEIDALLDDPNTVHEIPNSASADPREITGFPIGGGALCGKDPHKVDKCGTLRARQLAKRLVRNGATKPA